MEGLKELLHTYEQSIERKDQVISNLTRALQHQKDRFDMLRTFSEWKIRHNDQRREVCFGVLCCFQYVTKGLFLQTKFEIRVWISNYIT